MGCVSPNCDYHFLMIPLSHILILNSRTKSTQMAKVYSAPGKALIAGGYLVLDPAYNAYVTALSSRMHAYLEDTDVSENGPSTINVQSPQFGGLWTYVIENQKAAIVTEAHGQKNSFLQATIKTVINYFQPNDKFHLNVTLFSDPGYHTQEDTQKKTSNNGKRTFLLHSKPIDQVAKTGMGLSAGLVSVVTGALVGHFTKQPVDQNRQIVHNIAQIAHCEAQGKIGSGFDVAAAVYGSIIYRRFSPETIDHVLGKELTAEVVTEIQRIVDSDWKFNHTQCSLPKGIRLLMGDVNGGSETPKLVSKVLAWRKTSPESSEVYAELDEANGSFIEALRKIEISSAESLGRVEALEPVKDALRRIRKGLQRLTLSSGAEIEPTEQTALLDLCEKLPGCLGGVVPGAGGYDAICLLVEEQKLGELKKASSSDEAFANVTWLDLTEEANGLQEESAADYRFD